MKFNNDEKNDSKTTHVRHVRRLNVKPKCLIKAKSKYIQVTIFSGMGLH